ncbi:hypothetical protein AGLY_015967 [Aphis glycines]|uniref:Uncharacterized protein n=1 Tax=Aphis glycines TaxID=307491 RepID=A0A6G0SZ90_APHGL|nr:hypothetical protein AGLY_015967 [Aphis glycines]
MDFIFVILFINKNTNTVVAAFGLTLEPDHLICIKIKQVGTALLYIRGGVDLGLGITYEELCIKFSSILIGPKKLYRHFKKKISEKLKISVLKKTQNILKIKSCKENANLNNWINRYRYAISYLKKNLWKTWCCVFNPYLKHKTFYDFSTSKLLTNFRVFDRFLFLVIQNFFADTSKKNSHKNRKFQWSINSSKKIFELLPYKKIDSVENWFCVKIPVFPSFFFCFSRFF